MIAMRMRDCEAQPYGHILAILHAPVTEEAGKVLQRLLPDLKPATLERSAYHAGGRFWVHGDLIGWHPNVPRPVAPSMPSLLDQALSVTKAAAGMLGDLAQGRNPLADRATIQSRLAVCTGCPMLSGQQCSRCGCPVARKAAVASERCPDGKW